MSALTKEELKNALLSHGVPLPPSNAKKDEFVSLYEEHIAPVDRDAGDFSSDDEVTISPRKKASQSSVKSRASSKSPKKASRSSKLDATVEEETSLIVGDLDIEALDDEQLFTMLKENGINPGPIVGSTRPFYRKKLALLLKGGDGSSTAAANGTNGSAEFSDTEPETEEEQPSAVSSPAPAEVSVSMKRSASSRSKASSSSLNITGPPAKSPAELAGGLRRRLPLSDELDSSFARTTPTPRRSIHSYKVTETTTETTVRTRDGVETVDSSRTVERTESKSEEAEAAGGAGTGWFSLRRTLLLLLVAAVLGGGIYYLVLRNGDGGFSADKILADIKRALPLTGEDAGAATEAPAGATEAQADAAEAPPAAVEPPPVAAAAPVETVDVHVDPVEEPVRVVPAAEETDQSAVADV